MLAIWRSPQSEAGVLSPADAAVLRAAKLDHVICLLEARELSWSEETFELRRLSMEAVGLQFHSVPFEDFTAPSSSDMEAILAIVKPALSRGERTLLHCMAGLGRAGTACACVLVDQGMKAADAISLVRWVRPGAIQSESQEAFIEYWASR